MRYPNLEGVFRRVFPAATRDAQAGRRSLVSYYGGDFILEPNPAAPLGFRAMKSKGRHPER